MRHRYPRTTFNLFSDDPAMAGAIIGLVTEQACIFLGHNFHRLFQRIALLQQKCAVTLEDLRSVGASRFHRFHLVRWSSQFRIVQITDACSLARRGEFIFRKSRFATLRPIPDIKEYLDRCSIELLEKLREREALVTCSKKRCATPTCHCSSVAGFAAAGNCPADQMAFACSAVTDIYV